MANLKAVDPLARLSIVQRWAWRRRERQIIGRFQRDQDASLKLIEGKRILTAVADEPGSLVAAIETEACWVTMRGVSEIARSTFLEMTRYNCHIDGVGRYRNAWWIALRSDARLESPLGRVVVLASHVMVSGAAA